MRGVFGNSRSARLHIHFFTTAKPEGPNFQALYCTESFNPSAATALAWKIFCLHEQEARADISQRFVQQHRVPPPRARRPRSSEVSESKCSTYFMNICDIHRVQRRNLERLDIPQQTLPETWHDMHIHDKSFDANLLKHRTSFQSGLLYRHERHYGQLRSVRLCTSPMATWCRCRELDVSCNKLEALPPEIGKCIRLRKLRANGNYMEGIPTELGQCSLLEVRERDQPQAHSQRTIRAIRGVPVANAVGATFGNMHERYEFHGQNIENSGRTEPEYKFKISALIRGRNKVSLPTKYPPVPSLNFHYVSNCSSTS